MTDPDPFGFEALTFDWLRAKPGTKWSKHGVPYAAWVADMDFPPAPVIRDALRELAERGDLCYPNWKFFTGGTAVPALYSERCTRRFGWTPNEARIRELDDVMQGIQIVLHFCTEPGERVVVHTPCYPPFLHAIEDHGRRVMSVPAITDPESPTGWSFDHDELDQRLTVDGAKVLLLCNPHNPTGHVFSADELTALADLAERHDLTIVSDEIHADLVYRSSGRHRPIALFAPDRTVTITSASKAFNLAGVRFALAHIGPEDLWRQWAAMPDHLFGSTNVFGAVATEVAWRDADDWLDGVVMQLDRNRDLVADLLAEHLPDIRYTPPSATYLAWLDCRALGLGEDPSLTFLERGVKLSVGPDFGVEGRGFARLNFATSSAVLRETVAAMAG